jgi:hypothetical protein
VIIRRLIVPLSLAVIALTMTQAVAQDAVPLPNTAGTVSDPAFPPVNGAAPLASGTFEHLPAPLSQGGADKEACRKEFTPLREDAEQRGKLIRAASARHAALDEACKLIGAFSQAELKMIKYLEAHASTCGIPLTVLEQLKNGHKNSESTQEKVCNAATQMRVWGGPAGPSLNDVLGSPRRGPAGPVGDFDTVR